MARVIAAGDGFGFMCVDNASGFTERSETARREKVCVCVCDIDHHAAEKKPGATGQRGREEGSRGDL